MHNLNSYSIILICCLLFYFTTVIYLIFSKNKPLLMEFILEVLVAFSAAIMAKLLSNTVWAVTSALWFLAAFLSWNKLSKSSIKSPEKEL